MRQSLLGPCATAKKPVFRWLSIVAACVSYSRAIESFQQIMICPDQEANDEMLSDSTLPMLLQQRLGDACNETGKIFLNELWGFLASDGQSSPLVAEALLSSALFWFKEGVEHFEQCSDLRNLSMLRLNLCQAHKLRANSLFAKDSDGANKTVGGPAHAERCLQKAVNQLKVRATGWCECVDVACSWMDLPCLLY